MRYIKSYKIFESNDNISYIEAYLSSIAYDISVYKTPLGYYFTYNNNKYVLITSPIHHGKYDLILLGTKIIYHNNDKVMYEMLTSIDKNTKSLIDTISFALYDLKVSETIDRIKEFDIIKNGEIDYISLNSLYDFYNIEFNEDDFLISLDRIKDINYGNW